MDDLYNLELDDEEEDIDDPLLQRLKEYDIDEEDIPDDDPDYEISLPSAEIPKPVSDDNRIIMKKRIIIDYNHLKELFSSDFSIYEKGSDTKRSKDLITLNSEKNAEFENSIWMIMFVRENTTSQMSLLKFLDLAKVITDQKNVRLGFCNLEYEEKIRENFEKLSNDFSHPLNWAASEFSDRKESIFLENPFILIYEKTWPQGFYNRPFDTENLVSYVDLLITMGMSINNYFRRFSFFSKKFTPLTQIVPSSLKARILDSKGKLSEKDKLQLLQMAEEEKLRLEKKKKEERELKDTKHQEVSRAVSFPD